MRRREFITLVSGAVAAWPFTARAQAHRIKRLTILMSVADDPEGQARVAAFRQGLQQLGGQRAATFESNIGGATPMPVG